jgi:type II secretion system (T2SS) protein M
MIATLGLNQRDRRTLVVGFGIVLSLVSLARGVPALRSWDADRRTEAQSAARQVAALRDGLKILPALHDSLRARDGRLVALDSSLLSGASPSAVAANLASALEDLADDNALKITAMQLHADTAATERIASVAVRINGIADVTGFAGFLRAVEGNTTPMVVRALNVSQPEPIASDTKAEALHVDILVASIGTIKRQSTEVRR